MLDRKGKKIAFTIINPRNYKYEDTYEIAKGMLPEWYIDELDWQLICVIDDSGLITGILAWNLDDEYEVRINYIYVLEEYRRQHIATRLFDMLIDMLISTGHSFPISLYYEDDGTNMINEFVDSYPGLDKT